MRRPAGRAGAALVALLALASARCGGRSSEAPPPPAAAPAPAPILPDGAVPRREVMLLWPGRDAQGLVALPAEIFATREPADQARQVVGALLVGSPGDTALAPFPAGTRLTSLFVDARGIAYVSLSREAVDGAPGGSAWEQLAVHSLVGSLTRSVPSVHRVQILIEGQEIESLTGHLDLRSAVAFDEKLLAP